MSDDFLGQRTIHITKLDAARHQLATAVDLWFHDADPISIHTLAFAAYEIVHVLSKKQKRPHGLLFDSDLIKDEFRKEWNALLKKAPNFFKHANNDANESLDFKPAISELFMVFAIRGLGFCGEIPTDTEAAFMLWMGFQRSRFFSEKGRQLYTDRLSVEQLDEIRNMPKSMFLDAYLEGRKSAGEQPVP
jgi:hypothetical protein